MSTEGPEIFESLDARLRRATGDVAECRAEAGRLDALRRDLLSKRAEAIRTLARHDLPELSRPAIEATPEGVRPELRTILDRREAKRAELRGRIDRDREEARRLEAEIEQADRRLDEVAAERGRLEARVAEILGANADYQERSKVARQAGERLRRDERRLDELNREAAEKLPHYDKSRLFRYLHARGFGTPDHKAAGWVRAIDRRVADLIDYPTARESYEFLKKAPGLVAAEVARRRDESSELRRQVESIGKAEADRIGLTRVVEDGKTLAAGRDRLARDAGRLREEGQALQRELGEVEGVENRFYREAIDHLAAFLGDATPASLRRRARQAPGAEDDAIVDELARLDAQVEAIGPRLIALEVRQEEADRVREGLDLVLRRFRQANYDSGRSYFEYFDHRHESARFEARTIDAEGLWRSIQSAQRFRPVPVPVQPAFQAAGPMVFGSGNAMTNAPFASPPPQPVVSQPAYSSPPSNDVGFQAPPPPEPPSPPAEGGFTSGEGF